PLSTIEENNRLVELTEKEREEERKVLKRLTDLVSNFLYDLIACLNIMGKVDGIFARAEFSKAINGIRPILTSDKKIYLVDAFNPILLSLNLESRKDDKQEQSRIVVPIGIQINSNKNTLIISGPNRGGKTVALKTIGLLALMSQAGMHIPAGEGSILNVFNNILADIGDEQDILSGLSTFSARLEHLKGIANQATENSLVILDELGAGTDPDEGTAIAMAILDYLSEKGSLTVISTHYQILKKYGFVNKKAQNASVEFDSENKKPTFRLLKGAPGVSHAIEAAIDLGVKREITDGAANYLGKDKGKLNSMMEDLSRMMEGLKSEKEAVEIVKQEYGALKKDLEEKEDRLKGRLNEMLIHKENEIGRILTEAKREFGEAITLMRKKGTLGQFEATKKYSETKKDLVDTLIGLRKGEPLISCSRVTVGQDVFYRKLKRRGRVVGVGERSSKIQILMGNVKLTVDLSELSPVKADDQFDRSDNDQRPWFLYSLPEAKKELNIVGHTVDEAIPLVDTLIDKALVHGYSRVKIIHGMGLGVLKRAVREHLKGNHYVKSLIPGDRDGGSDGYTVVEL
ncbi:MAG: Smr/MutS family protein, partial [Thermodesulfobacteriota bacterium]|nr:Smr/MutS family protein [Thermodesulfobacteriota bacterium]